MSWTSFVYIISMAATVAFTVTAILAIRRESDIDILGAIVLGTITAIGGGTIRDLILDVPVFWASDLSYIWVAAGSSIAALYGRRLFSDRHVYDLLLYLDGFGAAMFSIAATGKVWDLDFGLPVAPVVLGLISAIGGGLIRDVLADRTTLLMRREIYATPIVLGCCAYVLVLEFLPDRRFLGAVLCILATFALRAAAIRWNLSTSVFARIQGGERAQRAL